MAVCAIEHSAFANVPGECRRCGGGVSALLIVGHGTRDQDGAEEFRRFVRRVEARATERGTADAVAGGFIELSPPPLRDAVAGLVEAGHRNLTAVPLILLAAGHAKGHPGRAGPGEGAAPGAEHEVRQAARSASGGPRSPAAAAVRDLNGI